MFWDTCEMKSNEAQDLQKESEADMNHSECQGSQQNLTDLDRDCCLIENSIEGNFENTTSYFKNDLGKSLKGKENEIG